MKITNLLMLVIGYGKDFVLTLQELILPFILVALIKSVTMVSALVRDLAEIMIRGMGLMILSSLSLLMLFIRV